MIYDRYDMAVLYKLSYGPQPISSLYCNTHQQFRLNDLMDAGIVESTPDGIASTHVGEKVYAHLSRIAELLDDQSYLEEAVHIDKMNLRRLEKMRDRYHSR